MQRMSGRIFRAKFKQCEKFCRRRNRGPSLLLKTDSSPSVTSRKVKWFSTPVQATWEKPNSLLLATWAFRNRTTQVPSAKGGTWASPNRELTRRIKSWRALRIWTSTEWQPSDRIKSDNASNSFTVKQVREHRPQPAISASLRNSMACPRGTLLIS